MSPPRSSQSSNFSGGSTLASTSEPATVAELPQEDTVTEVGWGNMGPKTDRFAAESESDLDKVIPHYSSSNVRLRCFGVGARSSKHWEMITTQRMLQPSYLFF
jgi:hypothetical protein